MELLLDNRLLRSIIALSADRDWSHEKRKRQFMTLSCVDPQWFAITSEVLDPPPVRGDERRGHVRWKSEKGKCIVSIGFGTKEFAAALVQQASKVISQLLLSSCVNHDDSMLEIRVTTKFPVAEMLAAHPVIANCVTVLHYHRDAEGIDEPAAVAQFVKLQELRLQFFWEDEGNLPLFPAVTALRLEAVHFKTADTVGSSFWEKSFPGLRELSLVSCFNLQPTDFDALAASHSLSSLKISDTGVNFAAVLNSVKKISTLRTLDLSQSLVDDIAPLAPFPSLTDLDLNGSVAIDDRSLAALDQFPSLKVLVLSHTSVSLSPSAAVTIPPCPSVLSVEFADCKLINDVSAIATTFPSLRALVLSGCNGVRDIQPLSACRSLEYLDLARSSADDEDVQLLAQLEFLQSVHFYSFSFHSMKWPKANYILSNVRGAVVDHGGKFVRTWRTGEEQSRIKKMFF